MRILRRQLRADGGSLVRVVAELLRGAYPDLPLSNADARRTVIAGAARINNRPVTRPGAPVVAGDVVVVAADPARLAPRRRSAAAVTVLFEDAHLIAVDKPPELPTHATADPARAHLVGIVARRLHVADSSLGVHQRLDAGTSGIVVFARTPEANVGLARAFASREVEKVYLAVADASRRPDCRVGMTWISSGSLAGGGTGRKGRRVEVSRSGQGAETAFAVRQRREGRVLIEARPATGRQHQIRAHLAADRLPIVGDQRYGGPVAERLCLHAWRLSLPHPVTGTPLELEAEPPALFRWSDSI